MSVESVNKFMDAWNASQENQDDMENLISMWKTDEASEMAELSKLFGAMSLLSNLQTNSLTELAMMFLGYKYQAIEKEALIDSLSTLNTSNSMEALKIYRKYQNLYSSGKTDFEKFTSMIKKLYPCLLSSINPYLSGQQLAQSICSILKKRELCEADIKFEAFNGNKPSKYLPFVWPIICKRIRAKITDLLPGEGHGIGQKVYLFWSNALSTSKIQLKDFDESFSDGKAICSFMRYYDKTFVIPQGTNLEMLSEALDFGQKNLHIPKLFEANEMEELVKQKSLLIFLYAAESVIAVRGSFVKKEQIHHCVLCEDTILKDAVHLQEHICNHKPHGSLDKALIEAHRIMDFRQKCSECYDAFHRKVDLGAHKVMQHEFSYCPVRYCKFAYRYVSDLRCHLTEHEPVVTCDQENCFEMLRGIDAIVWHLKFVHKKEGKVKTMKT